MTCTRETPCKRGSGMENEREEDGCGDADEVSFAAMTTTPDFLGSLSSRDEKMGAYHGRISRNKGSREIERERR